MVDIAAPSRIIWRPGEGPGDRRLGHLLLSSRIPESMTVVIGSGNIAETMTTVIGNAVR
jgi:hypothetical protein